MRVSDTTIRRKSSSLVSDFCPRPVILLLPPIINHKGPLYPAAWRDSLVETELQIQQSDFQGNLLLVGRHEVTHHSSACVQRTVLQREWQWSLYAIQTRRTFIWSSMTDGPISWFPMTQLNIFSEYLCWEVGFSGNMWIARHTVNWTCGLPGTLLTGLVDWRAHC